MRIQLLLIFLLVSLICWGGFFWAARDSYRSAQDIGLMPNLHIKERLRLTEDEL